MRVLWTSAVIMEFLVLLLLLTSLLLVTFLRLLAFRLLLTLVLLLASLFLLVSAFVSISVVDFPDCSRSLCCCRPCCCWCFWSRCCILGARVPIGVPAIDVIPSVVDIFFLFLVFPPWFLAFLLRSSPIAGVPALAVSLMLLEFHLLLAPSCCKLVLGDPGVASIPLLFLLSYCSWFPAIAIVFLKVYKYGLRARICNF